ncbi:DNA-binding response OmpR family regulator [Brevibacillus nitrificans]|nr:DNA-binding response OmpR family regulator [Brevibacillus nitrificans]
MDFKILVADDEQSIAQAIAYAPAREELLDQVWGMDYAGGTRTVDIHIQRLRSKLGSDHQHLFYMIGKPARSPG